MNRLLAAAAFVAVITPAAASTNVDGFFESVCQIEGESAPFVLSLDAATQGANFSINGQTRKGPPGRYEFVEGKGTYVTIDNATWLIAEPSSGKPSLFSYGGGRQFMACTAFRRVTYNFAPNW